MDFLNKILDQVDAIQIPLTDIKCVMIQSTGTASDMAKTFYDSLGSKKFAHIVIDGTDAVKYAYSNQSVIDPLTTTFTQMGKSMLTDPTNPKDNPACHIFVVDICIPSDYSTAETNAVKTIGDFLKDNNLNKNNVWRRVDIIQDSVSCNSQYDDITKWDKFLNAIDTYIKDPLSNISTGNTSTPSSTVQPDSRKMNYDTLSSIDADVVSDKEDYAVEGRGPTARKIDKFTNNTITIGDESSNLCEPIYPDLTVPPSGSPELYNEMVMDITQEDKAVKPVLGKIVNNVDPYPVDEKIKELEIHMPKVKIEDIQLPGSCSAPGCSLKQNDSVLASYMMELSKRTEKRIVQLENLTSTMMRYLFRLSSRLNINCVYYGGQSPFDKYNCIRCLADDMINDGQQVSLDQCLNCSRYQPVIGEIYDILNEDTSPDLGPILDDNQMARMSMEDYIEFVRIEKMHTEGPGVITDLSNLSKEGSEVKPFSTEKSFTMNWSETPLPQSPDIEIYNYNPDDIYADKDEKLDPAHIHDDGYKDQQKQNVSIPADGYDLAGSGESTGAAGGPARNLIVAKAKALIDLCKAGKARYSQPLREQTIDGLYYLDCSSFSWVCYLAGGIKLSCGEQSRAMAQYCKSKGNTFTDMSKAKPGDLVFYSANGDVSGVNHVAVYIGNGQASTASSSHNAPTDQWHTTNAIYTSKDHAFLFFGTPPELVTIDKTSNQSGKVQGTLDGHNYVYKLAKSVVTGYSDKGKGASGLPGLSCDATGRVCAAHNIPYGTVIYIPELKDITPNKGVITVADTGGPFFDFDINIDKALGKTLKDVYVLSWGTGKVSPSFEKMRYYNGDDRFTRSAFLNYKDSFTTLNFDITKV